MALPYGQSYFDPESLVQKAALSPGAHEGEGGSLGSSTFIRNYRRMVAANAPQAQALGQRTAQGMGDYAEALRSRLNPTKVFGEWDQTLNGGAGGYKPGGIGDLSGGERSQARAFFQLPWTQPGREALLQNTVGAQARQGYSDAQAKMDAYLMGAQGMQPFQAKRADWANLDTSLATPLIPRTPEPVPGSGGGSNGLPDWESMMPDWDALFDRLFPPLPQTPPAGGGGGGGAPPPTEPPPTQTPPPSSPPQINLPDWMSIVNGKIVNAHAAPPYNTIPYVEHGDPNFYINEAGMTVGEAQNLLDGYASGGGGGTTPPPAEPPPSNDPVATAWARYQQYGLAALDNYERDLLGLPLQSSEDPAIAAALMRYATYGLESLDAWERQLLGLPPISGPSMDYQGDGAGWRTPYTQPTYAPAPAPTRPSFDIDRVDSVYSQFPRQQVR